MGKAQLAIRIGQQLIYNYVSPLKVLEEPKHIDTLLFELMEKRWVYSDSTQLRSLLVDHVLVLGVNLFASASNKLISIS